MAQNKTVDPVCGMQVGTDSQYSAGFEGKTYYFCSEQDKKMFQDRPEVYSRRQSKGMSGEAPAKNDPNA